MYISFSDQKHSKKKSYSASLYSDATRLLIIMSSSYERVLWVYIVTPHLQTLVGCNNRSLIIDRCDTDVNGAGQTVLPDFRLIGHNGKVVSLCVAAVVDIGDVLTFHLETEVR